MKKRKQGKSPLAQLREGLKKTQQQFAELIGASESHIQKMEQGTKPVSKQLAVLLMLLFGCDPESVRKTKGTLKHLRPRTKGTLADKIADWDEKFLVFAADVDEIGTDIVAPKLAVLIKAAASRQHALLLLSRLDQWIEEMVRTLELEGAVQEQRAEMSKQGKAVCWEPFVRCEKKGRDDEIELFLSDETAELMEGKRTLESCSPRGLSQVNPSKDKRLQHLLKTGVQSAINKPKSPPGRATKRFQ